NRHGWPKVRGPKFAPHLSSCPIVGSTGEAPDNTIPRNTAAFIPTMIDVTGGKRRDVARICGGGAGLVVEDQLFGTSTAVRRHSGHTSIRAPNENAGSCRPQAMQLAIHPGPICRSI